MMEILPAFEVPGGFYPSCSVVICTRGRPEQLDRCIGAVLALDYLRFDVLVVDNAPTNQLSHEVAKRHGVGYLVEPVPGLSCARNLGARTCSAEIVAYLDDDSVPERGWLSALLAEFKDPDVMAVTGRIAPMDQRDAPPSSFPERGCLNPRQQRLVFGPQTPDWFTLSNFGRIGAGGNMAFRRSSFEVWAGFDERLGRGTLLFGGEEHHAFFSLIARGFRVIYTPDAIVYHPVLHTPEEIRERFLKDRAALAAYITLLFFEQPRYRRELGSFVMNGFRRQVVRSRGRIAPLWRELLSRLSGPLLYLRSRLAHQPSQHTVLKGCGAESRKIRVGPY